MDRHCRHCKQQFNVAEDDLAFLDRISPTFAGTKFPIPPPTLCPQCRQQRRLTFNNERSLYQRVCDQSGEKMISIYSPGKRNKVYNMPYWWSKEWDALDFGRDFDFTRPFFEQFGELLRDVPHPSLQTNYLLDENSEYTNFAGSDKNCYLIFHADYNRDCYYGYGVKKCESCVDIYNVFDSELCYECIDCRNCYNLRYSQNCESSYESAFLHSCIGCKNCFCCMNLHQKEFCVFNEQLSPTDYRKFLAENPLTSRQSVQILRDRFEQFCLTLPHRHLRMVRTENSFGDHLMNCKNVTWSFNINDMWDGKYCYQLYNGAKNCMDLHQFGLNAELVYDSTCIGYNAYHVLFSNACNEQITRLHYCTYCYHVEELFGCVGVRHKKYCVFNKQYSKTDYEALVARIIPHMMTTGEWGEFFPSKLSSFGYNETAAIDWFPLGREQVTLEGWNWHDEAKESSENRAKPLPDTISEIDNAVLEQALICEVTGRAYKLTTPELEFYRHQDIPAPTRCFHQRHMDRHARRNPRTIRLTNCSNCNVEVHTCYPEKPTRIIYCEKCYQQSAFS